VARSAARESYFEHPRAFEVHHHRENNYSGQFARYLRSETSYVPNGYIRKYDGEPFMPHHIVEAVKEQLASKTHETQLSVPVHEILV